MKLNLNFSPKPRVNYKYDYVKIIKTLREYKAEGQEEKAKKLLRKLCRKDLFFLGYFVLGIRKLHQPWIVRRIREVEKENDRTLDLWARGHFKSTIITYLLTIQEIINDPDQRICIFSNTRQIAKGFMRRLKHTFEQNKILHYVFDDIFYDNPQKQAPKWSEDDGLIVKRNGQYNEATIEAWGIIDGMPTGKHYTLRIYDDLVTEVSVNTSDQIKKTRDMFRLSHGLSSDDGRIRLIGTTYHYADLYCELEKSGAWGVRKHSAEDRHGKPVLLTEKKLAEMRSDMGRYMYSAQMLLNPVPEEDQCFFLKDLQFYEETPIIYQKVIIVDPASEKKKGSDYTVMMCIGFDRLGNIYILDMVRDRMRLSEKWLTLSRMVEDNNCHIVGYEKYGAMGDLDYIEERQGETGLYFEVHRLGGHISKSTRIGRLVPLFEAHQIYLPETFYITDANGKTRDMVHEFIQDEFLKWPAAAHDDMLDALSRIKDEDMDNIIPKLRPARKRVVKKEDPFEETTGLGYMAV